MCRMALPASGVSWSALMGVATRLTVTSSAPLSASTASLSALRVSRATPSRPPALSAPRHGLVSHSGAVERRLLSPTTSTGVSSVASRGCLAGLARAAAGFSACRGLGLLCSAGAASSSAAAGCLLPVSGLGFPLGVAASSPLRLRSFYSAVYRAPSWMLFGGCVTLVSGAMSPCGVCRRRSVPHCHASA